MANQIYNIPKSITIIYRFKQNPDEKRKRNPQQPIIQASNYICNLSHHNPSIKQDKDAKPKKKKPPEIKESELKRSTTYSKLLTITLYANVRNTQMKKIHNKQ